MLVLVDYEWGYTPERFPFGAQLAACRIDDDCQVLDTFSMQIHPSDAASQPDYTQMGFGGLPAEVFENSPSLKEVMQAFGQWLREDDRMAFWAQSSVQIFKRHFKRNLAMRKCPWELYGIREVINPYLKEEELKLRPLYDLCEARGLEITEPRHNSEADLQTMLTFLRALKVDIPTLRRSNLTEEENANKLYKDQYHRLTRYLSFEYVYDPIENLVHMRNCEKVHEGMWVRCEHSVDFFIRKQFPPCDCVKSIYKTSFEKVLEKVTQPSQSFPFVASKATKVVHTKDCPDMLKSGDTSLYMAANLPRLVGSGLTLCPVCNPRQPEKPGRKAKGAAGKPQAVPEQPKEPPKPPIEPPAPLSPEETAAQKRYTFLTAERKRQLANMYLTPQQKADIITLTSPQYAFWLASGYRNFHKRECPKLRGMTELIGFSGIGEAMQGGNTACKICKPSKKENIKIYIPLETVAREGETPESLLKLCADKGLTANYEEPFLTVKAQNTEWKTDLRRLPVILVKKAFAGPDKDKKPSECNERFLSFQDAIEFIEKTDTKLTEQLKTGEARINVFR
ncbi:MAG: hypothetical protein IJ229_11675 [Clostridia bacterium]|nr:hypothetical protein [Clostridia bacterium]MBR1685753.1 hypothetical protein [Clostridia bacterium]